MRYSIEPKYMQKALDFDLLLKIWGEILVKT